MSVPDESDEHERRRAVMDRLAEMLQGPPPAGGGSGPVTGDSVEAAIAELGLGLDTEDTAKVAGAVREGPDPEEAAALFRAMLEGFQAWRRKPRSPREQDGAEDETPP